MNVLLWIVALLGLLLAMLAVADEPGGKRRTPEAGGTAIGTGDKDAGPH